RFLTHHIFANGENIRVLAEQETTIGAEFDFRLNQSSKSRHPVHLSFFRPRGGLRFLTHHIFANGENIRVLAEQETTIGAEFDFRLNRSSKSRGLRVLREVRQLFFGGFDNRHFAY
ncbi:MAG: hypothetical protein IJO76_06190, partial [Clostridia bacterium]|nr:hypothetical protein [Clostridia bacterium]